MLFIALFLSAANATESVPEVATACQVRQLAVKWDSSPAEAAKRLKDAVEKGDKSFYSDLGDARWTAAPCKYSETGLNQNDAEALALFWSTDVDSAERMVEAMFSKGQGPAVWDARSGGEKLEAQRFIDSNYHQCDARMLGELWGVDPYIVKTRIGREIVYGDARIYDADLVTARSQSAMHHPCTFAELSYTYDDAKKMARIWTVSIEEAQKRMIETVMGGFDAELRKELGKDGRTDG